jgi:hypothetical protein
MKNFCLISVLILFSISPVQAKHKHLEKYYQTQLCNQLGGVMEYRLPDAARVDCLTDEYAIETDFENKWAESCGQALFYSLMTGKKPGIQIIVKSEDSVGLKRVRKLSEKYDIRVWVTKE